MVVPVAAGVRPPGFRLPPETRAGAVTLRVSDLDRSLGFYRDLLGFRLHQGGEREATDGREALLGAGADPVSPAGPMAPMLLRLIEHPEARPVAPRSRLGLFHFAVLLPSRAALGRLLRHLGERDVSLGASDHGVSEALYLSDPDGLGIELYRDRPREDWRSRGRELVMTTQSLDASGVMAAADGEWQGMPQGTRIGHVHLHVGDLAMAESFYHQGVGLDKTVWSYPGALFLSAGGYHHHLGLNTWAAGARPAGEQDAGLVEWTLIVPDDETLDRLDASLRDVEIASVRAEDGLRVDDPWGTRLRVISET